MDHLKCISVIGKVAPSIAPRGRQGDLVPSRGCYPCQRHARLMDHWVLPRERTLGVGYQCTCSPPLLPLVALGRCNHRCDYGLRGKQDGFTSWERIPGS